MSLHSSDSIIANYLALMALRRSHATLIPVISYYGYGRQDRKDRRGVPISAKDIAELVCMCEPEDVVILDPHNRSIEGYFKRTSLLYGSFVLITAMKKHLNEAGYNTEVMPERIVQVAPDDGRVEYNNFYAKGLGIKLVLHCKKITLGNNKKEVIFTDTRLPKNAVVAMSDDLIDTFGTIYNGTNAINAMSQQLYGSDCSAFFISGTHGRFSGSAIEKISKSRIQKVIVTDSIPELQERCEKISTVSIVPVLAEAIRRIHNHESISDMFGTNWTEMLP